MALDSELEKVLESCMYNTKVTAQTFFPERFNVPFSAVHDKIFELIDGPEQKVAIAAPRGWGKTSIVALALISRYILFRLTEFVVYINMSHDAAALQTENLRRELVTNRSIKSIFGPVRPRSIRKDEIDESFSKKAWVAYDTFLLPRGSGQQVRGVLYKNSRPGLIVIDDLEDPETITSDEIRAKRKNWLYADVIKAVPRLHQDWKVIYIDTLKHEDSLLQHLLDADDWASVRLEACDDNFQSAAPEFMSNEQIMKEWKDHERAGMSDVFFRELRNLPISTKDSAFQKQYFRYYNKPRIEQLNDNDVTMTDAEVQADSNIENVILVDPAKTLKVHSAETAIVNVGISLSDARLYIRDCVSEKMYPDDIYNTMFDMAARSKAAVIGVEETSLNEFIKQPIKNEMLKRGKFYELVWLKPRGGDSKEKRIKELVPYYRMGYIYHNASCATIPVLESQLMMYPRSRLWDLMDCLAYIIYLLEMGERYFSPSNDPDDPESEYSDVEYDAPLANWRAA